MFETAHKISRLVREGMGGRQGSGQAGRQTICIFRICGFSLCAFPALRSESEMGREGGRDVLVERERERAGMRCHMCEFVCTSVN